MKKITIIIPNYNNEKYLKDCLGSVVSQDYPEKEIIVVDDGSTDDSVKAIREFIKNHSREDIKLICQPNLNAAIARNSALAVATGDYVLFLDSDDWLENGVLSKMISMYEENQVDLVVGNYERFDEDGESIGNDHNANGIMVYDIMDVFADLINMSPVPSNKLYDLKLIKENNLWWGNLRIGQDLNFYLKYLALCDKVLFADLKTYNYRIVPNSMTRTYDFRIFDIVNGFDDTKKFYAKNGKKLLYDQYLPVQALRHYNMQMTKQRFYDTREVRMLIVKYFMINEKRLDYSKCKNRDVEFVKTLKKFHRLYRFRWILTSEWFKRRCERKERRRKRERK